MGRFKVGDRVRSRCGWEAIVYKISEDDFWLYSEGMNAESACKYRITEDFDLVWRGASDPCRTLRDQFAMAALPSATQMAINAALGGDLWSTAIIAECAYQYADAMLAERGRVK